MHLSTCLYTTFISIAKIYWLGSHKIQFSRLKCPHTHTRYYQFHIAFIWCAIRNTVSTSQLILDKSRFIGNSYRVIMSSLFLVCHCIWNINRKKNTHKKNRNQCISLYSRPIYSVCLQCSLSLFLSHCVCCNFFSD